ncbi:MAG: transmembrane domain-containing protein [Actinobacteria bacterium]|nr:transmembrane domain-containing protein [Actinomycetota bacterium]
MSRSRRTALLLLIVTMLPFLPSTSAAARAKTLTARSGRWSEPSTWGGKLPSSGDKVRIPRGANVLLDTDTASLAGLRVDGTLRFARKNLDLTARWVMIHGTLRIGTEAKPFEQRATITLTGAKSSRDVMGMGTKFLGVMGGTLDLHGAAARGWTRLAATAAAGDDSIQVGDASSWETGDQIATASTDYWSIHDEVRTITGVEGNTLVLDKPLRYQHWGTIQDISGHPVDERAEVGLLTRNIVVQGDASSSESGFGGHTMFMGDSTVRIDGVTFDNMGQRKKLRRYPVHFHMDGSADGSYVRNSAIANSFNRCLVIHGTNRLVIDGNVCHDHLGHGFFLEDGAEVDNVITNNLGFGTRSVEDGLLPSDRRPATFWITNPDNVVNDNVAAGSEGAGFWYALPEHPTGPSATSSIWPRRTPLKSFRGNVAHSNGDRGLNVDDGPRPNGTTQSTFYNPRIDPADEDSDPVTARFEDFTAYMNRDRGIWLRGTSELVTGAVLADNRAGATFASDGAFIEDSFIVGETANMGTAEDWEETGYNGRALPFFWDPNTPILGFEFYDGLVGVSNVTFAGLNPNPVRESGALGYLAPDAFSIDPNNYAENITVLDSNPVYLTPVEPGMDGDASKVFVDSDGSVTGTPGRAVVVDNPFLLSDRCTRVDEWNAHICDEDYVSLYAYTNGGPTAIKPLVLTRDDGVEQILMGCCEDSSDIQTSLIPGRRYGMKFTSGAPSDTHLVLWRGSGRWIQLSLKAPAAAEVTRWGQPLKEVAGPAALAAQDKSAYFYDSGTKTVHIKLVGDGDWEEIRIRS